MAQQLINQQLNQELLNINSLYQNLSLYLLNCSNLLYQKIIQKVIQYSAFDNQVIDVNYIPKNLNNYRYFNDNQVKIVIDYYVDQCNIVLELIMNSDFYSQLSNYVTLINKSIADLNNLAVSLFQAQNKSVIHYVTPRNMSIRTALFLNGLDYSNIDLVVLFNNNLISFNYIHISCFNSLILYANIC